LGMGETLTAEELSRHDASLQRDAQKLGRRSALPRRHVVTVTVTGGSGERGAPASTRDISSIRHVVSATYNRQLSQWNRAELLFGSEPDAGRAIR
jgi:hypothetical protein